MSGLATETVLQPRRFNTIGVQVSDRFSPKEDAITSYTIELGARGVYERAELVTTRLDLASGKTDGPVSRDLFSLAAAAPFGELAIGLPGGLVMLARMRVEFVGIVAHASESKPSLSHRYVGVLPGASLSWRPVHRVALYGAYDRSFGPPQFLQFAVPAGPEQLRPEVTDTVEVGAKLQALLGISAGIAGWRRYLSNLHEVSFHGVDTADTAVATGVEAEVGWQGALGPLVTSAMMNYARTHTAIVSGPYLGNAVPWYPRRQAYAELAISIREIKIATSAQYQAAQYSDYSNTIAETSDGDNGVIPAVALWHASIAARYGMDSHSELTVVFGVRNILDRAWYLRTDDRNAGILPQQPRTFSLILSFRGEISTRPRRR